MPLALLLNTYLDKKYEIREKSLHHQIANTELGIFCILECLK